MMKYAYKILEIPVVYQAVCFILGPGGPHFVKKINERIFQVPARRALDIGCGPAATTPEPIELLVGVDVNEAYIRQYTGGSVDTDGKTVLDPPRRRMGFVASGDALPFPDASFDEVRGTHFFHHLTDEQTIKTLQESYRVLKPGGRIVMFDMIRPRRGWLRPIAWLVVNCDRGRYVRTEEQMVAVFQKACPGHWEWERHTYTYTGLEMLCLQFKKP